jgi:hypothetical protein
MADSSALAVFGIRDMHLHLSTKKSLYQENPICFDIDHTSKIKKLDELGQPLAGTSK